MSCVIRRRPAPEAHVTERLVLRPERSEPDPDGSGWQENVTFAVRDVFRDAGARVFTNDVMKEHRGEYRVDLECRR